MIKDRQYNIINYFIDLAKQKRALTIFGNGMQRRDYVYIDDVVNALLLAPINQIAYGQIYNIGYGKPIAFKDMVTGIAKKGNVKINYMPWPPEYLSAETGDYYCEISKAKKQLNWKPTISYEKGIDLCFG
jgi:nucleoside-diphosphate-sugar epimerase